jgi:hypothetical protein
VKDGRPDAAFARPLVLGCMLGAALGLAAGWGLWHESRPASQPVAQDQAPPGADASTAVAPEIERLRERLAQESARREALEKQLAAAAGRHGAAGAGDAVVDASGRPIPDDALPAADGEGGARGEAPWVDAERLAQGGFAPSDVELLQRYFEALELDRLYLRDRATREGWIDEPRYRQSMRALDIRSAKLRSEYGDDAYDWILYASKRPNRVVVQRVMEGSQAEAVGLEPGDVLLEYDGERIFGVHALRTATTRGALGETADVEIERDGRRLRVFPERGPLGISLQLESREPGRPAF